MIEISIVTSVDVPTVPNFIRSQAGAPMSIAKLDDATLRAIGSAWTDKLVARARELRKLGTDAAPPAPRREHTSYSDRIDALLRSSAVALTVSEIAASLGIPGPSARAELNDKRVERGWVCERRGRAKAWSVATNSERAA